MRECGRRLVRVAAAAVPARGGGVRRGAGGVRLQAQRESRVKLNSAIIRAG